MVTRQRLYSDLASWWPLMSPPSDYVEEAAALLPLILGGPDAAPARTLLELGAGGGSLAWHLKQHLSLTLTDLSPEMRAVSQSVNPECEHVVGDMTSLDLNRQFDRVLIHDAIDYATDVAAVHATLDTARRHCRPGGIIVVVPDAVRDTLELDSDCGGHDGPDGRALRYLEWSWDPDPSDDTYETLYVLTMRTPDGEVRIAADQHRAGCFRRADWLSWLAERDLQVDVHHDQWNRDVFVAVKRGL
jgi:hypothetical protein